LSGSAGFSSRYCPAEAGILVNRIKPQLKGEMMQKAKAGSKYKAKIGLTVSFA